MLYAPCAKLIKRYFFALGAIVFLLILSISTSSRLYAVAQESSDVGEVLQLLEDVAATSTESVMAVPAALVEEIATSTVPSAALSDTASSTAQVDILAPEVVVRDAVSVEPQSEDASMPVRDEYSQQATFTLGVPENVYPLQGHGMTVQVNIPSGFEIMYVDSNELFSVTPSIETVPDLKQGVISFGPQDGSTNRPYRIMFFGEASTSIPVYEGTEGLVSITQQCFKDDYAAQGGVGCITNFGRNLVLFTIKTGGFRLESK